MLKGKFYLIIKQMPNILKSQFIKKFLPLIALLAISAVFFFCDSFVSINHSEINHQDQQTHHQTITIAHPERSQSYNFIEQTFNLVTFFPTASFSLIVNTQLSVLLLFLASLLFILKLYDPFLRALREGTLQPKTYNLAFI